MKVELKANGKTVQVEMTKEQLKELGAIKPRTGYERRKECNNKKYYFVNAEGLVIEEKDTALFDQNCYNTGNYYSNKTIAENNARADRLFRQLRQWQAQNDKAISAKAWKDGTSCFYNIRYNYWLDMPYVNMDNYRGLNNVYFTSEEKAEEAIKIFRNELNWYFTEYQQRLDEE